MSICESPSPRSCAPRELCLPHGLCLPHRLCLPHGLCCLLLLTLVHPGVAQDAAPSSPGGSPSSWVADLGSADPVVRDAARRRLALADPLPVDALVELLRQGEDPAATAAATLLRDRAADRPELRQVPVGDTALFRAVLPLASETTLVQVFREGPAALRPEALYLLEDRGRLTDDMLVQALTSADEELAAAACRVVVLERAPFPLEVVQRIGGDRRVRLRLVSWLADRPRRGAGPFIAGLLAEPDLPLQIRILAINALPNPSIDLSHARLVLTAAAGEDLATGNRARSAAARLLPAVADKLIPEILLRIEKGTPAYLLLPCLERVSADGERLLLEHALRATGDLQADIFHWLNARQSKLVDRYVGRALDGNGPFPVELLRLVSPILDRESRVAAVARMLDSVGAVQAYSALIDAKVYHPAMLEYALGDGLADQAGRLRRLLELPVELLPKAAFVAAFDSDSQLACLYAVNSMARRQVPKELESRVVEYAEFQLNPQLQLAAARALILHGSEAAGRRAFAALRSAGHLAHGFRFLMERPKPWSYEILLKERERCERDPTPAGVEEFHGVLIALARLGDRGAREQLLEEVPRLGPTRMRQLQEVMGRILAPADLRALAEKHLAVRAADPQREAQCEAEDERRVDLLEWLLGETRLDLSPLLADLFRRDRCYELRLVALRGLLARDTAAIHAELRAELAKPFDETRRDLAFEVIGSMVQVPIPPRSLDLLARIVLRAPLTLPRREIALGLEGRAGRGDYPLVTPAVNLLRLDEKTRPGATFAKVAAEIGAERYALNRQRLGRFLAGLAHRESLLEDLGPTIAGLILAAPDTDEDYLGPARLVLAEAAEVAGDLGRAAELYRLANRAFSRGLVPEPIRRSFLGAVDPVVRYHPAAALAARAPIARARSLIEAGRHAAARAELSRALDLAEGDATTIEEIEQLEKSTGR